MLAAIINAYGNAADWLLFVLTPAGSALFWLCSLAAIPCLLLAGENARAATEDDAGLPQGVAAALVAAVTVLGAALRFYGRDALPFWWDELLAVWIAKSDLPTLVRTLATPAAPASDFTPPLFYLLLHAWQKVFGLGEGASRLLTAGLSTLTIPALFLLARRLTGTATALAAAFLLSVSATAVYYSQQTRAYALLALLAVLFFLAAEAVFRRPGRWRVAGLIVCGVLFLHTHFVATWMYAALCATYAVLATLRARELADPVAAVIEPLGHMRFPALVTAGFLLASLCPLFTPPAGGLASASVLVWAGLALLAALLLAGLAEIRDTGVSRRQNIGFLAALAAPGFLFLPWLLSTRIWEVIAGQGATVRGVYGLKEMGGAIDALCGLDTAYTPYLLGLGFFSLLTRRPRSALLVAAWTVVPMGMAMYVQNQNMQLVRYLFLTQTGYLLLLAAGAVETMSWPVAGLRRLAAWGLPGLPVSRKLVPLAGPVALFALFGFTAFGRISFPTRILDVENYPLAARDLAGRGHVCPGFPNPNLLRAISWYLERDGVSGTTCAAGDDRVFLVNANFDGTPWSSQTALTEWLDRHGTPGPSHSGIRLFTVPPAPLPAPAMKDGDVTYSLSGRELFLTMDAGHDIGCAQDMLHPLFKGRTAMGWFLLPLPEALSGRPARVSLTVDGLATGPESFLRLRLFPPGQPRDGVVMTVRSDGSPRGGLSMSGTDNAGTCAMSAGKAVCAFPSLSAAGQDNALALTVELFDDATGAIYSSDVALRGLDLTLTPEEPR